MKSPVMSEAEAQRVLGRAQLVGRIPVVPRSLRRLGQRLQKILGTKPPRAELPLGHGHGSQVLVIPFEISRPVCAQIAARKRGGWRSAR